MLVVPESCSGLLTREGNPVEAIGISVLLEPVGLTEHPPDAMPDDGVAVFLRHAESDPRVAEIVRRGEDEHVPVTGPLPQVIHALKLARCAQVAV